MAGRWKDTLMKPRYVSEDALKRFAIKSTRVSALLERRVVPIEFKRSQKVEKFLAERQYQV